MIRTILIALLCSACAAPAFAQGQGQGQPQGQGGQGGQGGGHHGPPQEALDACKGKKDGDRGQMRTPRGDTMNGVCRMVLVPPADGKEPAGGQRKDGPPQR
jgi:hypothetical protein